MAEYLFNDAAFWLSKLPESALNTHYTTNTDYLKVFNGNPFWILPQMEKRNDENRPGNGHEFITYVCNHYWSHPAINLEDDINVEHAGRLLLRALGGTVTDTLLETGVTKHSNAMLPLSSGRLLPSSDFISFLGGSSFLLAGCVVDRFRMFQNGPDPVRSQCDLLGTGKHIRPHGVSSLPATASILQCLTGNNVAIQWTDGTGTRNWSTLGRVKSWFCEVQNNTKLNDRRPGDPVTSNGTDGAAYYVRYMNHGVRRVTAQLVVTSDNDVLEWLQMTKNEDITDVTFSAKGPTLIGATQYPALTMIIPHARITAVSPGSDDDTQAHTIDIVGAYDSVTGGALKAECVNTTASNFK
ncbi:MAG TPA: hypothetical protein VJ302_30715 [Blastocatellia bacterium]|nr:hypothetical protein [Blastocatellia bacterium]